MLTGYLNGDFLRLADSLFAGYFRGQGLVTFQADLSLYFGSGRY